MTDYNKQAEEFLIVTNTTLEVKEAIPQKATSWGKDDKDAHKHINYSVTLKNAKHSYTFDYWGSINDWEKVEKTKEIFFNVLSNKSINQLREYLKQYEIVLDNSLIKMYGYTYTRKRDIDAVENAVLQAIKEKNMPTSYDILACLSPMYEDTFEDFCYSFGYDADSRTAEDTYKRCIEQDRQLHKLFTHEELEQLSEIN